MAAVLQTGVNLGVVLGAAIVGTALAGAAAALRSATSSSSASCRRCSCSDSPPCARTRSLTSARKRPWAIATLGAGPVPRGHPSTTLKTTLVYALGLSAWWLFLFWHPAFPPDSRRPNPAGRRNPALVPWSFLLVNASAIAGNFAGGWLARRLGNPRAIAIMFFGLGAGIVGAFVVPRSFGEMAWFWCPLAG